ncbi:MULTISPECIES: radical SAM/SPASM domain-containing protein [Nocardia]|uniref:radical SAM/SPASM domain-containing protein n=1 Tax=Nocardia TaxID=1817 RepID=UPI00135726A9|nr:MULTISPECIES: radical SAM protein [Nocardia]
MSGQTPATGDRSGYPYLTLDDTDAATAVSVILKLRGETCDIDCLFCYEKRKESPGGARIDVEDIGRLPTLFGGRPIVAELHGGEPLTAGKSYVRGVLARLAAAPSVTRVTMQTNGIRLDEEWLDLFDEVYPDLRIGISLDGDPEGNSWRIGYDGRETYTQVAAALRLLGARGRKVGVITVVTPRVLGRAAAVLDHLAGFDAVNAVSLVPCFDSTVLAATATETARVPPSRTAQRAVIGPAGPAWAITGEEYAQFVLDAAAHWATSGLFSRIKLEPVVSTIRTIQGLDTGFCHFSNLKCDHVFTVYPDGRFGSCDELPWPEAQLGNLRDLPGHRAVQMAQRRLPLLVEGRALAGKCADCRYRHTCGGGCVATRLRAARSVGSDDDYCRYRMRLVDGVAAIITQPDVRSATWCRQVKARPHQPNSMADVAVFLRSWRDPGRPRLPVRLNTSAHGNINTAGEPGVHEADDLDPMHPAWREAIEPGVWPLVDAITREWGLVTYDSCQGHRYDGLELVPAERRVGVLPRDRREYAAVAAALCRVVTAAESQLPLPVRVVVGRAELTCTTTGVRFHVLDLRLERREGSDWTSYFANLETATEILARKLSSERSDERTACSCQVPDNDGRAR